MNKYSLYVLTTIIQGCLYATTDQQFLISVQTSLNAGAPEVAVYAESLIKNPIRKKIAAEAIQDKTGKTVEELRAADPNVKLEGEVGKAIEAYENASDADAKKAALQPGIKAVEDRLNAIKAEVAKLS